MAIHVMLGNPAPLDRGVPTRVPAVTYVSVPDSWDGTDTVAATPHEVLTAISTPAQGGLVGGLWDNHSVADGPEWVWSDDEETERLLSEHYECARGIPEDVEDRYYTTTPPGVQP